MIIILHGNDGVGKSTLCRMMNEKHISDGILCFQRSCYRDGDVLPFREIFDELDIAAFDKATLTGTFESRPEMISEVVIPGQDTGDFVRVPVFRVILTASLEVLKNRVSGREILTEFETEKSLSYFNSVFHERAYYYGIPMVSTEQSLDATLAEIMSVIQDYGSYQDMAMKNINRTIMNKYNILNALMDVIDEVPSDILETITKEYPELGSFSGLKESIDHSGKKSVVYKEFYARAILNGCDDFRYESNGDSNNSVMVFEHHDGKTFRVPLENKPYFLPVLEGESKQLYQVVGEKYQSIFSGYYLIALKSTIYSHSMQSTGEIEGLADIRGLASKLILEEMWRNNISHAYKCITDDALVLSKRVKSSCIESVFKAYCTGTDKHSYYELLNDRDVVLSDGQYVTGPYPRFDMRNPNHVTVDGKVNISRSNYYYIIERFYGKQLFFERFLKSKPGVVNPYVVPMGDKTISPYILSPMMDVFKTQTIILKTYSALQNFFSHLDIVVQDGCLMIAGDDIYSELNPDCCRLKSCAVDGTVTGQFDKDIHRGITVPGEKTSEAKVVETQGGSSTAVQIKTRWVLLNEMMTNYFKTHRFMDEINDKYGYQLEVERILGCDFKPHPDIKIIWRNLRDSYKINNKSRRQVIVTMDMSEGNHVLVQRGKVSTIIGKPLESIKKIEIFPNILLVDLDGAIAKDFPVDRANKTPNREVIKELATRLYTYVGGGIRNIYDAQEILSSSATRIVIGSNLSEEFLSKIPKERCIVELSVDEHNKVLTHGRLVQTDINIIDKINELDIEAVSITFHQTEGLLCGLPRAQISDLIPRINKKIKKIIIAGGISSLDDIHFLWSFDPNRVIPQVGSALWRERVSLGDIYDSMANYTQGLIHATIQSENGIVKGPAYLDSEALKLTVKTGLLHRFSREHQRGMMKGETSGDTQRVIKICFNCHNDHLLITVADDHNFCHRGCVSCFPTQTSIKGNMCVISSYIEKSLPGSYMSTMKRDPNLCMLKLREELREIHYSDNKIHEISDFIAHLLPYINSLGVPMSVIYDELNRRHWDIALIPKCKKNMKSVQNKIFLGITNEKYFHYTVDFALEFLGVAISKVDGRERTLGVRYDIVDPVKYAKYFGVLELCLVPHKPKDIVQSLTGGIIDGAITYNVVLDNQPNPFTKEVSRSNNDIRLSLIKRKSDVIDPSMWTEQNKAYIACEHPVNVHNYLKSIGIDEKVYTLNIVSGSSEIFMVNETKTMLTLCDAIVSSGQTLKDNNLEVWRDIVSPSEIEIGLYLRNEIYRGGTVPL